MRAGLEEDLKSLLQAGVEEALTMEVEDCPLCKLPQINLNTADKVFHCRAKACNLNLCHNCQMFLPDNVSSCLKCFGPSAHKAEAEARLVKVGVQIGPFGNTTFYELEPTFQIGKLKELHAKKEGVPSGSFRFLYKGKCLKDEDTPKSLEMKDDCVIVVEKIVDWFSVTKVFPKREIEDYIDVVKNETIQSRFEKKKAEFSNDGSKVDCLLLFHGTPQQNIHSILHHNFDLGKKVNGRVYGDRVYFSEQPEVSNCISPEQ